MSLDTDPRPPRSPLAWSVKVTLIIGLAATALGHHIAKPFEKAAGQAGGTRPQVALIPGEPEVTGSIGARARVTRLDPCALRD